MKTKSIWGYPPRSYTDLLDRLSHAFGSRWIACVVGASDGKFVLPLTRRGIHVTCYDVDKTALFGGIKTVPTTRFTEPQQDYEPSPVARAWPSVPSQQVQIQGLVGRLELEGLSQWAEIRCTDYFRDSREDQFHLVFTSCSLQYKWNRDLDPMDMISRLMRSVCTGGFLAMDYMMPLEERHTWKPPQYLRQGVIETMFDRKDWQVLFLHEPEYPVFEAAHVDRPNDHFHRIGQITVQRIQ